MNVTDEIKRLHELHQAGALTDAEFAQAKTALLSGLDYKTPQSDSGQDFVSRLNHFRLSKTDRWLGGVCGGLAKTTGLESWIWRLLFVFLGFCFAAGFLIYGLAWIFVPSEK